MTHRIAKVRVENQSGQGILSVSVAHKYSDNYTNSHTWKGPVANNTATPANMDADFNTGLTTTGRDWWAVTWVTADGNTHVTDPNNLRNIVDFLEKTGQFVVQPAASLALALATVPEPAITKATAAAAVTTAAIVSVLCNGASPDGYKQHILRSNDTVLTIRITASGVDFCSASGTSRTGARVINAPA